MTGPYDLDAHVRRVLAREQRLKEIPPRPRDQLQLFEMAQTLERPPERYETGSGLVVDDELSFARAVSLHSALKAYCARRYAEIVGVAMARKWELWWIELFAGPGRLYVRETGKFVAGSPIEALRIRKRFHGYAFADLDPACVHALRRRAGLEPNVHVLEGDANGAELLDRMTQLIPKNALVVLYGDPAGLDLDWQTLQFFIDRWRHLDLLLNVPIAGVVRAVSAGYDRKAISLLDHPHPRELLAPLGDKGDPFRDWYARKLAAAGFDQFEALTIRLNRSGRELYDLVLASRNPLAPKFFDAAVGQPMMSDVIAAEGFG